MNRKREREHRILKNVWKYKHDKEAMDDLRWYLRDMWEIIK
jgi:hypothetical protein